ncbi:MAG: ribonuclease H-like domain-containing protein [Clostridia bacterium]|nr:ribonuclease H-like domain-containing protein [Clostridia bacterium]
MSTLRDRLRQISARQEEQNEPEVQECLVFEKRYPLLPHVVSEHAIHLLFPNLTDIYTPEGALFLDTETTGLSTGTGTVAFLVGIGYEDTDSFRVCQYLMRDYPEEDNLLDRIAFHLRNSNSVFSYNGRTFDIPLLRTRFIMNGKRDAWRELEQGDLLYPARRIFRRRLLDCSLGNIETNILDVARGEDIPGALIPARYNLFLQTRDMGLLNEILAHNQQDIYSLYLLLHKVAEIMDDPYCLTNSTDRFSVAVHLQRAGERQRARELLTHVENGAYLGKAQRALSILYRQDGSLDTAIELLKDMARRRLEGVYPFVELAKIYEHAKRDYDMALKITEYAVAHADLAELPALMHRRERLVRKIHRAESAKEGS